MSKREEGIERAEQKYILNWLKKVQLSIKDLQEQVEKLIEKYEKVI